MAHHNSQQNNNLHGSGHLLNLLTPPLTAPINNQQQQQQQQQQLAIHVNNNIEVTSSQSVSLPSSGSSLTSSGSSTSMESTSPEVKTADELFDKIEDMICDYMREPNRHYLHCRVLRWCLEDDQSRRFSAVVIINPPTANN